MTTPQSQRQRQGAVPPYTVRPPRGFLLWAVPGAVISLAMVLSIVVYTGFGAKIAMAFGLIGAFYYVRLVWLVLAGATTAHSKGLRVKMRGSGNELKWNAVRGFEAVGTPFGRRVMLINPNGTVGTRVLPAPREGLFGHKPDFDEAVAALVARRTSGKPMQHGAKKGTTAKGVIGWLLALLLVMLLFEKPWHETWYPTNDDATALPSAGEVLDQATAQRLVPGATLLERGDEDREPFLVTGCRWGLAGQPIGVELRYQRYGREGGSGGTANARDRMLTFRRVLASESVTGLGDEAWMVPTPNRYTPSRTIEEPVGAQPRAQNRRVQLLVRRQNVVVFVDYEARLSEEALAAGAKALARTALSRVRFG